jgi:hypothetical protein
MINFSNSQYVTALVLSISEGTRFLRRTEKSIQGSQRQRRVTPKVRKAKRCHPLMRIAGLTSQFLTLGIEYFMITTRPLSFLEM